MKALCMIHLTTMTRHTEGHLYLPKVARSSHRVDLHPLLDSIWVYRVDNEDDISVVVFLRPHGDDGFQFSRRGDDVAAADFLRLREYLESAGILEVESHIIADSIIERAVEICMLYAAESEAA